MCRICPKNKSFKQSDSANPPYWYKNKTSISITNQFKLRSVSVIIVSKDDLRE